MRVASVSIVAIAVLVAAASEARVEGQGDRLVFDVASVKPNKSGTNLVTATSNATQVIFENVSLDIIISQSFRMRDSFIVGMPGWARQERFDIHARTSKPTPVHEQGRMLENLLADRFVRGGVCREVGVNLRHAGHFTGGAVLLGAMRSGGAWVHYRLDTLSRAYEIQSAAAVALRRAGRGVRPV